MKDGTDLMLYPGGTASQAFYFSGRYLKYLFVLVTSTSYTPRLCLVFSRNSFLG